MHAGNYGPSAADRDERNGYTADSGKEHDVLGQYCLKLTSAFCVQADTVLVQPAVADNVMFQDLIIDLGQEVTATYMDMVKVQVSGQVSVTGPADPEKLHLNGTIKLDRGQVRLSYRLVAL